MNYDYILNEIYEIYESNDISNIRQIIYDTFKPTKKELQNNAEVSTPPLLVNEILDNIPKSYFQNINKTIEPSCGKGNFVLAIFESFYINLRILYPDPVERCRIIIEECIHFVDIEEINVYINAYK